MAESSAGKMVSIQGEAEKASKSEKLNAGWLLKALQLNAAGSSYFKGSSTETYLPRIRLDYGQRRTNRARRNSYGSPS